MYYFGANIKITGIFQRFQTEVHALRVIETKVTTRSAFNRDHFGVKGNYESDNNEKTLLWVFLQISDPYFITLRPPKNANLSFSNFNWFLQFLSYFMF